MAHGPGIDEPLWIFNPWAYRTDLAENTVFLIPDGLGSVVMAVSSRTVQVGQECFWWGCIPIMGPHIMMTQSWDSFGNVLSSAGKFSQPYAFTGREGDPETGLYFYRARYMDPNAGRFISEDPTESVNLYAYVGNDPVNWTDPFGLAPGDIFKTQDAAAIDAIDFIMKRSDQEGREYGGYIYRLKKGGFSYTKAKRGTERSIKVSTLCPPPKDTRRTAIYHTHPGTEYTVPYFSTDDYFIANFWGNIYLGTISGWVKEWHPGEDVRIVRKPFK